MKGILISETNQSAVGTQWFIDADDYDDLIPVGWVLLADFGGDWYEGVMSKANFDAYYDKGEALDNEYFIVTRKPEVI
jgi:hypothetical protein